MNALWLNRIYAYKNSPHALATAKQMLRVKFTREARSAKQFWRAFGRALSPQYGFRGRKAHANDVPNKLLDIGFHHTFTIVRKILEKRSIPVEVGIFHTAHTINSAPLVYDLVELFRADLVGTELLRFLRLKNNRYMSSPRKILVDFYGVSISALKENTT